MSAMLQLADACGHCSTPALSFRFSHQFCVTFHNNTMYITQCRAALLDEMYNKK